MASAVPPLFWQVGNFMNERNIDSEKAELFERMPIPKAVLKLSVPTIIGSLVMMLYNLADTYFVGMLNNSIESSAVTLAAPVLLAFNAINNLFGVGGSSMMSRALGRGDLDTVRKSSAFSFYGALFSGVLFAVMCTVFASPLLSLLGANEETAYATSKYLFYTVTLGAVPAILNVVMGQLVRAEGSVLHASIGTMSGCLLNIVLDPIFILPWGLDMGAAGAGFATFISNCFACAYFFVLVVIKRGKTYVTYSPKYFSLKKAIIIGVCAVGIPASIQNLLNVTGMTVLNNFTAGFGTDAVTAMGISHKISMIPMYIALGISQGIMPLISYNYASGNVKRMKKAFLFTTRISVTFLAVIAVIFFVFSAPLIELFMKDPEVIDYGKEFLRGMALAQPFLAMDFIGVGVYQACGMGKKSLVFALMRKVVLEIPALYLFNFLFPLYGLAYAQFAAEFILAIAAVIVLAGIFRRLERENMAM